jgi:hypothetical protein
MNSQKKGKKFERDCAHLLSNITGGAKWNRVPQSGAMATVGQTDDPRFKGDLFSDSPRFKEVVVECKIQRKPINLQDLVNPKSIWNEWLEQTKKESGGRFWLLMFRWNAGDLMIAAPTQDMELLKKMFDVPLREVLRHEELLVVCLG